MRERVPRREDRDTPVQEVCGDTVWGDDISRPFQERVTTVGGENNGRRHWRFKKGIEVSETFDIQHVNLTDGIGYREY